MSDFRADRVVISQGAVTTSNLSFDPSMVITVDAVQLIKNFLVIIVASANPMELVSVVVINHWAM